MKKSLFFGLGALLALGVTSCSKDDLGYQVNDKPLDHDQTFYANIAILGSENATRAIVGDNGDYSYSPSEDPGFNKGTGTENDVETIYFIFYDKDKNRVATTQVRKDNATPGIPENDSENSIYNGVIQIDVKQGMQRPAYVMCFINPITATNFDVNPNFATLTELEKTTRESIIDANGRFAMSKSVYYGVDRVKNPKADPNDETLYEKIIATPIPDTEEDSYIFSTREEAEKATNKVLDIYVERYAAKVNLTVNENAPQDLVITHQTLGDVTLKFVPEYWAVNAYESSTYAVKSFLRGDEYGMPTDEDLSYEYLNGVMRNNSTSAGWKWNNPTYHRCYWAQSPAYYRAEYPRNADDINDIGANTFSGEEYFALGYYSYDDMVKNATDGTQEIARKARKVVEGATTTIYARENTISGESLQKAAGDPAASAKAAIGSAVLVGHYTVQGPDDAQPRKLGDEEFFYVMGSNARNYEYFGSYDSMLRYFLNTTIHFSKDEYGIDPFFGYTASGESARDADFLDGGATYKNFFTIVHPDINVRTGGSSEIILDSRFVTIQINKNTYLNQNGTPRKLYALVDGKYTEVTSTNIDYVNRQMLYAAGTVQGFKGGKAFFSIPIKHLGFYRPGNKNYTNTQTRNLNPGDAGFDWKEVRSGDFGLVRNHMYSIEISQIKGLGNGIPNPGDPIVPPTDPEEYYVGARLIILNWAVVPTQGVVL